MALNALSVDCCPGDLQTDVGRASETQDELRVPRKVGGRSANRRDVTLQLRSRVAPVTENTSVMVCSPPGPPNRCRGSSFPANPVGAPPKVGGRSANRRDATAQLRKRVALVAENTLCMVPCPRGLPNRCRGASWNAQQWEVPPIVGGRSANRRDVTLQLRKRVAPVT